MEDCNDRSIICTRLRLCTVPSSMDLGPTLTIDQQRQFKIVRDRWFDSIFSTKPANRRKAEDGVRRTYRAAGVMEPELFLWFDGLLEAAIAAEQLGPLQEANWMLPPKALSTVSGFNGTCAIDSAFAHGGR